MARGARKASGSRARSGQARQKAPRPETRAPEPVDVVNGIPDRSASRPLWAYIVLALIFLGWLAFLVTCGIVGAP